MGFRYEKSNTKWFHRRKYDLNVPCFQRTNFVWSIKCWRGDDGPSMFLWGPISHTWHITWGILLIFSVIVLLNAYSLHTLTIQIVDSFHFLLNVLPCHLSWKLKENLSSFFPHKRKEELSNLALVVPSEEKEKRNYICCCTTA